MFDPELYRKKEEVSTWKERDPINFLKAYMLDQKLLSEIVFQDLTKKVEQEMQEAVAFAEAGSLEPVEDLEKYVYENDL